MERANRSVNLALVAWFMVALVPGSYLMASHLISLPAPSGQSAHALGTLRQPAERGRWMMAHVLLGSCGCSGKVLEHLLERGPRVAEHVLFVDGDQARAKQLQARGFAVESLSSEQLAQRYSIESAPLLVVLTPEDHVAYSGGYTDRKQSAIRDVEIFDQLLRGQTAKPLPLFGCAVSKSLRKSLDPLGLKGMP